MRQKQMFVTRICFRAENRSRDVRNDCLKPKKFDIMPAIYLVEYVNETYRGGISNTQRERMKSRVVLLSGKIYSKLAAEIGIKTCWTQ